MKTLLSATLLALLAAFAPATTRAEEAEPDAAEANRARNLETVARAYEADRAAHAGNPDMLVRRGLLANRKDRSIRLWGEGIALDPQAPVEFVLVGERSGHGYEALACSFAAPGDLHDALVFIGLEPGLPFNPRALRFWPKGERVFMTFRWTPASIAGEPEPAPVSYPVESLVYHTDLRAPLPAAGLVFTGSRRVPPPGSDETNLVYAADAYEPHSLASLFNSSESVLDVPRLATQGEVYSRQLPNRDRPMRQGALLEIAIRPEYADGRRRVLDLTLRADAPADPPGPPTYTLAGPDGAERLRTLDPFQVVAHAAELVENGRDPFVTLEPGDRLTLKQVRELCGVLASAEGEHGLRMEPPPPGLPYYRAFLPDERFRRREDRIAQPRELRFSEVEGALTVVLTELEESWPEDAERPTVTATDHAIGSPAALATALASLKRGLPVILIYAPDSLLFGRLRPYLEAALPACPTLYVFTE